MDRSGWVRLQDSFDGCPTAGWSPIPQSEQARTSRASSSTGLAGFGSATTPGSASLFLGLQDQPASLRSSTRHHRSVAEGPIRSAFRLSPEKRADPDTIARLPILARSLSEGSDRRVWIGTSGSLIEFDGVRFRGYHSARSCEPHD